MTLISVLIPTFRRPDSFLRAAQSVFAQRGVADIELIAVDNSPEGSALGAFEQLAREAPIPFRWTHAPVTGVAQARNAAFTLARGDLLAWLDDDQEATPDWLAALVAVRQATGAQSVFGPVRARARKGAANASFFEQLYSRSGGDGSGTIAGYHGVGNSLQPRRMFGAGAPFDTDADRDEDEGERLFSSWSEAGAMFAWAADAVAIEHLGAERTRLAYSLKRAFVAGQAPCAAAWGARDYLSLARHMSVGVAQAATYGFASLIIWAGSTPHALALLDRAVQGAGKALWFWEQRFCSAAALAAHEDWRSPPLAMAAETGPLTRRLAAA